MQESSTERRNYHAMNSRRYCNTRNPVFEHGMQENVIIPTETQSGRYWLKRTGMLQSSEFCASLIRSPPLAPIIGSASPSSPSSIPRLRLIGTRHTTSGYYFPCSWPAQTPSHQASNTTSNCALTIFERQRGFFTRVSWSFFTRHGKSEKHLIQRKMCRGWNMYVDYASIPILTVKFFC